MAQRLVNEHRLVVGRETVRELLNIIDREGVEKRLRHRLKGRQYQTKGPNFCGILMDMTNKNLLVFVSMVQLTATVDVYCGWRLDPPTMTLQLLPSITSTAFAR